MAIGDDAIAAGYQTVPDTGEEGRVRWGAREINRTRDYIAAVKNSVMNIWSVEKGGTGAGNKAGARANLGQTSGTAVPPNTFGDDGDWYMRVVG